MSRQNLETVARAYEHFRATGEFLPEITHPDFVWGRSKSTGVQVEMHFGQVFTLADGKQLRMEMYADPAEALEAAGLAE